jgi:hypothetical protein
MTSSGTEGWRPCWKTPCNDPGVVPACGELGIWGVDITWDAQTGYHCSITTNDLYYYMHARGQTCD